MSGNETQPLRGCSIYTLYSQGSACGRNPGLKDIAPLGQDTATRQFFWVIALACTLNLSAAVRAVEAPPRPAPPKPVLPALPSQPQPPEVRTEFSDANYDEVIHDLLTLLDKDAAAAQDASTKLSGLGKKAIIPLTETLNRNYIPSSGPNTGPEKGNKQVALYSAIALARIKNEDAGKALLPILMNVKAPPELRAAAVTAIGLEMCDEGAGALQKLAAKDPDVAIRRSAFNRLLTMPKQWMANEKLFLDALNDDDSEIRTIAAKLCYYAAKVYRDAAPNLIAVIEKETLEAVRTQAYLALGRMGAKEAVPALVRLYVADETKSGQAITLRTINQIVGFDLKDKAAVQRWWEKMGEKEYSKYEQLMQAQQAQKATETAANGPAPTEKTDTPAPRTRTSPEKRKDEHPISEPVNP